MPPKINVNTGGKGGTVVLIAGTLFIGYLFFTRRLQNVFSAINLSPKEWNLMLANQGVTVPPGGTAPAPVTPGSVVPRTGSGRTTLPRNSRRIIIYLPPQYGAPLEVELANVTDRNACKMLIYRAVLDRTGSNQLAGVYSELHC